LSALSPDTGVFTIAARSISRDPQVVSAMATRWYFTRHSAHRNGIVEAMDAQQTVHEPPPVLIQHGSADELVRCRLRIPSTSGSAWRSDTPRS
jgi:hypothetical protein